MWQRQPCGIPEIGGKDRETGLSYPVEINLLAEVELMIAGNESIEPHIVEEIDNVGALVQARQPARRQGIAGVEANKLSVETRHAAASVLFFDPVALTRRKETGAVVPSACAARVDGTAALAPEARIDARVGRRESLCIDAPCARVEACASKPNFYYSKLVKPRRNIPHSRSGPQPNEQLPRQAKAKRNLDQDGLHSAPWSIRPKNL